MILTATSGDEDAVVQTLTLAFSADPAVRWTWPDPTQFLEHFPRFVRAFGGHAFRRGSAYRVDGNEGAALWLPPGVQPDDEAIDAVLSSCLSSQRLKEVMSVMEQMGGYHPGGDHWYLPLIGVDPFYQGRGHGAALMKDVLRQCDEAGHLAYLESTNPRNIGLYERHGFVVLGRIQQGDSPTIVPMLRQPRNTG
ncbi:MAG: GNAT family N-acetyltransferase [Rubrivivax sp.]|nr:MAG: GNAT family N-acetyltransferase [Rubrivivax sp.]